jgi:hypothetical protein
MMTTIRVNNKTNVALHCVNSMSRCVWNVIVQMSDPGEKIMPAKADPSENFMAAMKNADLWIVKSAAISP